MKGTGIHAASHSLDLPTEWPHELEDTCGCDDCHRRSGASSTNPSAHAAHGAIAVQLSDFIVAGQLAAKIDKVSNVVETTAALERHAQYQRLIKDGDLLLNRIQKLSKIVDVE